MPSLGRSVGFDELSFFNRQLASMARLNLPFPDGLRTLAREVEGAEFKKLVTEVLGDLEEGQSLSDALSRHPYVFSDLYLGIVAAGEESGDLASSLEGLANYSESMLFLRQRIRATMAYPTIAAVICLGMVYFLFTGIVPKFQDVFNSIGMELPGLTRFYLDLAVGLKENSLLILTAVSVFLFVWFSLRRMGGGARTIRQFTLNLPIYGKLLRQVLLLRFCETLRALLKAKVSLVPALDLTSRTLGANTARLTVEDMRVAAEEGRRVSDVLRRNTLFPKTFVWKFALAEEQGTLEATLSELTRYLELELKTVTARFSAIFEPLLIVVFGLLVGSMVISVFLPIFELQSKLSG